MGFLQDWFTGEVKKTYATAEKRAQKFDEMLVSHQEHLEAERIFANMKPVVKKVPYAGLPFHPVYEQRNMMYPHQIYTRRPESER